jgi:serine/threonine-protein kinase
MAAGDMIAGRYRLEGRLGAGGMSTVHLAFDERLERKVAVKLLAEHLADDPAFVSRFKHEALAAARLVHPNVVQVFDSGLDEASHRHFIVMEFVSGSSCAELLRDKGSLPCDQVARIIGDGAEGLDYAHRHGVVHRDVKPGNLLVADSGVVKLADFGIAKATEQSSVTQVGSVLGTAAYLAPEQARGEDAEPACDIYALGVVAYQLASGRLPYEATSLSELALKQQQEVPPRLDVLDPTIPTDFANAVESALSLDPAMRPVDAATFASIVRGHGDATASTRVLAAATSATAIASDPGPATTVGRRAAQPPRQPAPSRSDKPAKDQEPKSNATRRTAALLAVIALLGGGAAVAVVASGNSSNSPNIKPVTGQSASEAIQSMHDLVDSNTR